MLARGSAAKIFACPGCNGYPNGYLEHGPKQRSVTCVEQMVAHRPSPLPPLVVLFSLLSFIPSSNDLDGGTKYCTHYLELGTAVGHVGRFVDEAGRAVRSEVASHSRTRAASSSPVKRKHAEALAIGT